MKQNYFLKAAGVIAVLVLMSNQAAAQSKADQGQDAKAVKVIDSKGTIKYFQSNNGITQITNSTNNVTTTTWQLGGVLTDDTFIDASLKAFALKGLAITASTASKDGSAVGYTLLVSDAVTGKVERVVATSLIQAGTDEKILTVSVAAGGDYTTGAITGLTDVIQRVSVFRNGIRLRPTTDWLLGAGEIKIKATTDLPLYTGDIISVQWVK